MNTKAAFLFFSILVISTLFSCKKEESGQLTANEEMQAATAATIAETESEFVFNDVFDNVIGVNGDIGIPGVGIFGKIVSNHGRVDSTRCFITTITPQVTGIFPKTVVLDFGTGCTTRNMNRSGKIKTVYTGRLTIPGSSATTTFEHFKIDNISVEGTQKITNVTPLGSVQKMFEVQVIDGKITKPDGNYSVWNSKRVVKQLEGNLTETHQDDMFSITGSGKGRVKTGNLILLWNSQITEPLHKKFICRWISRGQIHVLRETLGTNSPWMSLLDYGTGTCDNKATITINGETKQITLR